MHSSPVCLPELLYEFTDDFTASQGSGYVEVNPTGSITTTGGKAMFTAAGALKYYRLSANDWRGDNLISFTFLPQDPLSDTGIGLMTNSLATDTGSLLVTWSSSQVGGPYWQHYFYLNNQPCWLLFCVANITFLF